MSLTLEQILRADDKGVVKVACPEWGGDVYVRTLSADERDAWETGIQEGATSVRATLLGLAMCSEDGTPLAPSEAQVQGLGKKASGPMDRLFEATLVLNKMRKTDLEKLEGNSEATAEPA